IIPIVDLFIQGSLSGRPHLLALIRGDGRNAGDCNARSRPRRVVLGINAVGRTQCKSLSTITRPTRIIILSQGRPTTPYYCLATIPSPKIHRQYRSRFWSPSRTTIEDYCYDVHSGEPRGAVHCNK